MADETTQRKAMIVDTLKSKSVLKQKVFDNTGTAFMMVKEILKNLAKEVNGNLAGWTPGYAWSTLTGAHLTHS